jgi:hypothetical protein
MAKLIVLSWNLRTFGHHPPSAEILSKIADVILDAAADIVCIQEIQVGHDAERAVGGSIGVNPRTGLLMLCLTLRHKDEDARWNYNFTGPDSGLAGHMRDAYAFLWRQYPSARKLHDDPCDEIYPFAPSQILRSGDSFWKFGRRPGQMIMNVRTGGRSLPVQLISFHAGTKDLAEKSIRALPKFPEVGGFVKQFAGRWPLAAGRWAEASGARQHRVPNRKRDPPRPVREHLGHKERVPGGSDIQLPGIQTLRAGQRDDRRPRQASQIHASDLAARRKVAEH